MGREGRRWEGNEDARVVRGEMSFLFVSFLELDWPPITSERERERERKCLHRNVLG